jgi:hypothetical protein
MSQEVGVETYVRDPGLLVELILEVIDRLDSGQDELSIAAMEAQLREISKAIDNLDKAGVAIPDALRAEKTRLAAALAMQAEATQALSLLTDELDDIVKNLKSRLGNGEQIAERKPRAKRSKSPKTGKDILQTLIVEALEKLGGSAHKNDVLKYMQQKLEGKLLPGDLEWRDSAKEYAWQNNACWERFRLIEKGILKSGSPRGIWELSEAHQ